MKKILQISNYYYPYIGGVGKTAQYLAEGMKNFETRVVCFSEGSFSNDTIINGVRVYKMKIDARIASQSISYEYYFRLKRILKEFCPDVVLIHAPNPFVYALLLPTLNKKTKLVVLWHSDVVSHGYLYTITKWVEKKLLNRADLILVTSPLYRDSSVPLRHYVDKVKILPSAIDTKGFSLIKKEELDKVREVSNGKPVVFFVGRHVPYKGLEYLVKAEKYIKSDCVIIIAGDGPLTDSLKMNAGGKIVFVGHLSDTELKAYQKEATIFAFPSITRNEAFGLALAEAMYCECVPVTFTIEGSGVNWVSINGETGLEVANSDYLQFAKAIDTLLSDENMRNKLKINARERVVRYFTVEREIELATQYFNELLS